MKLEGVRDHTLRNYISRKATRAFSVAMIVILSLSCGGSRHRAANARKYNPDVAAYRLLLRDNPVDSGAALHCYSECQSELKPDTYLSCLSKCPGFEVEKGFACEPYEIPPEAACITARRLPNKQEIDPGYKVIATIAGVVMIVALGVACTSSSSSSCGAYYYASPGQRPAGL